MKTTIMIILPFVAIILLLCGGGCSVVGYTVGSAIDEKKEPVYNTTTQVKLFTLAAGDEIRIEEKGKAPQNFTFERLAFPAEADLITGVADHGREAVSSWSIAAGDRILLSESGADEISVVFLGATTSDICYRHPDGDALLKCRYHELTRLRSGLQDYSGHYLQLLMDGRLDGAYTVLLREADTLKMIPMRKIENLFLPDYPTTGRRFFTLVGAAVDIAALAVLTPSREEDSGGRDLLGIGKWLKERGL